MSEALNTLNVIDTEINLGSFPYPQKDANLLAIRR